MFETLPQKNKGQQKMPPRKVAENDVVFLSQKQMDPYFAKKKHLSTENGDASPRYPDILSSFPTSFALDLLCNYIYIYVQNISTHHNVSPCGCFFAQKAIADSFVKDWIGPGFNRTWSKFCRCASDVQQILHLGGFLFGTPMNQPMVSVGWVTLSQLGSDGENLSISLNIGELAWFWASKSPQKSRSLFWLLGLGGTCWRAGIVSVSFVVQEPFLFLLFCSIGEIVRHDPNCHIAMFILHDGQHPSSTNQ